MKITIKQLKRLIKEQVEEAVETNKDLTVFDIKKILKTKSMADRWFNKEAMYDDAIIEDMPLELFTQLTGLTEEDIIRINDNIEPYEGSITVHKSVTMHGGD